MNIAMIMMAGKGERTGLNQPKQFIIINGKPLFMYSVLAFQNHKRIDKIVIVTNKQYIDYVNNVVKSFIPKKNKVVAVIEGGEQRYLSVYNGINYIIDNHIGNMLDNILIHDGARGNITEDIITQNIAALTAAPCVLTAIPAERDIINQPRVDTIHIFGDDIYKAQTPQSFKLGVIKEMYDKVIEYKPYPFTDEISIATAFNYDKAIVIGNEMNYKITTLDDINRFKLEHEKI